MPNQPNGTWQPDGEARALIDAIPHVVWVGRADGWADYFNRQAATITGVAVEGLLGHGWMELVHPDDRVGARAVMVEAARRRGRVQAEFRLRCADDGYRWMHTRALPMVPADDGDDRWIGTWSDVHDARVNGEQLREEQARTAHLLTVAEAVQTAAPVAFALVAPDLTVVRANSRLRDLVGIDPAVAIGRRVPDLLPDFWPDLAPVYERVVTAQVAVTDLEVTFPLAGGGDRTLHTSYYPVTVDGDLVGVGIVGVDVSERHQAEALRIAVMDHMAEGLCALDADGRVTFVNHAAARMLGWTEAELQGQVAHDVMHFQRADGSAFPAGDCPILKVHTEGRTVRITEDVFTRKDGSLLPVAYSAAPLRGAGGQYGAVVVFRDVSEELTARQRARREIEALSWIGRIQDALEDDRLELYTQPIVPLNGGQGAEELLLRLRTPTGEIIAPGVFLPVAEKYGLIVDVDRWVVARAVAIAATGRTVEVNLSAATITHSDLLPWIERTVREHGADPHRVVFEITETALMDDIAAGEAFARGLAELGCRLALDDFGTGFASFTYLKRLPIDFLKIDIEFVRDVLTNPANQHVIRAIVNLARAFGHRTVAEGVEDAATLEFLRDVGVDLAQGYHLGRPAPLG